MTADSPAARLLAAADLLDKRGLELDGDGCTCNACQVDAAIALWLRSTAEDARENLTWDSPDCPNCGTACAGHDYDWFCDRCAGSLGSDDEDHRCLCYPPALAVADALLRTGEPR